MMNLLHRHAPGSPNNSSPTNNTTTNTKRRALTWRPRTAEEIVRKRNRKVVSSHLKKIGKAARRELSLDQDGVCVFSFKKFVVVVEVPEDSSSIVLYRAKVCHVKPEDNQEQVQKLLEVYNHRQQHQQQQGSGAELFPDTSSASESTCPSVDPMGHRLQLTMDGEEVNLCFSVPIQGLSFQNTADNLEQFVKTAVAANRKLSKIKSIPTVAPTITHLRRKPSASVELEDASFASNGSSSRCHLQQGRSRMWSLDSQSSVNNMSQCSLFNLFVSTPAAPTCAITPEDFNH